MRRSFTDRKRFRKSYGKIEEVASLPNLIELQKKSYDNFLQHGVPHNKRKLIGLHEVLTSTFPLRDFSGKAQIEYFKYDFDDPKYDEEECRQRSLSYSASLKTTFRLVMWDVDEDTGARSIRDIKEQDVYMGDMPLMTDRGTFIINGIERVIVSQMHRSPGVFFDHDKGKTHSSGKLLFAARIVPYRGSWLDFEFDPKDILNVRIDRKKKFSVTTFLMALHSKETEEIIKSLEKKDETISASQITGVSPEEMLHSFHDQIELKKVKGGWAIPFEKDHWKGFNLLHDLIDADTKEVVANSESKLTPRILKNLEKKGLKTILLTDEQIKERPIANDYINEETGKVIIEAGDRIDDEILEKIQQLGLKKITVLHIDDINVSSYFLNTLKADKNLNREEALLDIYRTLRPGEPPTLESAEELFKSLFFDAEKYDLSSVGRVKINGRLNLDIPDDFRILSKKDIFEIVKTLLNLKDGHGEVDDIDNLGNRRVRSVGELVENQYRLGLSRMERAIKERMTSMDMDIVMPHDIVNAKPAAAALREFFGTSQLSQFMDQTNPLSEVTHKRRMSALGPGGLSRERAGMEVRDVHTTHYGRICPIETPEGANIGLINSLATYARINQYGFIESPYRRVENGKLTDEVHYFNAMEEARHIIAQANMEVDENGNIVDKIVICRKSGEVGLHPREDVTYMDVSPKQVISAAASLIPFLENDDANRALMGSNMQRQAVPLIRSEAPFVGTGMESKIAKDSGASIVAKRSGIVDQVDGQRIVIRVDSKEDKDVGVDIYNLRKFQRSNMSTCLNQKPLVKRGDFIEEGDIIADGPAIDMGELALGRNALVSFLSWNGYNFEDSIIISEKIAQEDVFTSVHIDSFEVAARDTKLGNEEISRDIPNIGEEHLRNLDEAGIIYVGASVKPGDILVGKVTPKGETPSTPEERLLRAIFGEKAADVKDSSLRVPPGTVGTVVDVQILSRRGVERDERAIAIERQDIERVSKDRDSEKEIFERNFYSILKTRLLGQKASGVPKGFKKVDVIDEEFLSTMTKGQWRQITVSDEKMMSEIESMKKHFDERLAKIQENFTKKVEKLRRGDELPPGVLKMVKVFIAKKRKLQPGDKMAGRHGNKGVVSKVLPVEDMPHLPDGTPVDIILNPLGLPSRMNVGQILETHLGWASSGFGSQINEMYKKYMEQQAKVKDVRDLLKVIYTKKKDHEDLDSLSDEELIEMASNLRKGVPMATPVFDGAKLEDVTKALKESGLDQSGQSKLIDGRTGEYFDRPSTIGYIYMLKLHHLVEDKIHARSIGPYSLVTQQPLGGKAQFGGQRFGEMEVWALEAYGAAYTLQEMLTVKSDDVQGRTKVYEAIVRGDDSMEAGVPESFNVLVKELRSLCINMEFEQTLYKKNEKKPELIENSTNDDNPIIT